MANKKVVKRYLRGDFLALVSYQDKDKRDKFISIVVSVKCESLLIRDKKLVPKVLY